MRKFMFVIKTIILANQELPRGMEPWVLDACDINNIRPSSWLPSLLYGFMSTKSLEWSSCVHLHFHSGCVAELGAESSAFLSPVPPSSSGHWTCAAPSFPLQWECGNTAPGMKKKKTRWVNKGKNQEGRLMAWCQYREESKLALKIHPAITAHSLPFIFCMQLWGSISHTDHVWLSKGLIIANSPQGCVERMAWANSSSVFRDGTEGPRRSWQPAQLFSKQQQMMPLWAQAHLYIMCRLFTHTELIHHNHSYARNSPFASSTTRSANKHHKTSQSNTVWVSAPIVHPACVCIQRWSLSDSSNPHSTPLVITPAPYLLM